MSNILNDLKEIFKGKILTDAATKKTYSHDASIYELVPDAVLVPKNSRDIQNLVSFVAKNKALHPSLAITARSAATDMSGGAIGGSLVVDMTGNFNKIHSVTRSVLHTQPGAFMRDIDPLLDDKSAMLGCVPASRALCTIGGMVGNNAGGEQSLRFGNTEESVLEMKVVFADGKEYVVKPLSKRELDIKMEQGDYEGELYRQTYELIENNYDTIKNARPKTNKNSMGYNLWSVWDRDSGIFDLTHLISGSQGTLGIITDLKMKLHPKSAHSGLLVLYLPNLRQLGDVIATVMDHKPATFEGFDDITFNLGIRYFKTFQKQLGMKEWLKQQASLAKSVAKFQGHIPNMVLMVEFEGNTSQEVGAKIDELKSALANFKLKTEVAGDPSTSTKFWSIRRASLSLLRNQVKGKYATPFIDDLTVQPKYQPEFLPRLRKIIRKYKLPATIAGHFGDGNFHIIPLMDISNPKEQAKLEPAMREIVPLVLEYGGTLAGEHNDGMVRGPWLTAVFGQEVFEIFRETKEIFDPQYIFNPHKKTDASWEYSMSNIRKVN